MHRKFAGGHDSCHRSSNRSSRIPRKTQLNMDCSSAPANVLRKLHRGSHESRMPIQCFEQSLASQTLRRELGPGGSHGGFQPRGVPILARSGRQKRNYRQRLEGHEDRHTHLDNRAPSLCSLRLPTRSVGCYARLRSHGGGKCQKLESHKALHTNNPKRRSWSTRLEQDQQFCAHWIRVMYIANIRRG